MERETFEQGAAEPTPGRRVAYFAGYFTVQLIGALINAGGWVLGVAGVLYVIVHMVPGGAR